MLLLESDGVLPGPPRQQEQVVLPQVAAWALRLANHAQLLLVDLETHKDAGLGLLLHPAVLLRPKEKPQQVVRLSSGA